MYIVIIFRLLEFIIQNWFIILTSLFLGLFIITTCVIISETKPITSSHKSVETQTENKMDIKFITS